MPPRGLKTFIMIPQKDIEKIAGILDSWKEKLDTLQGRIDSREETFGNRSERWQESEKGMDFEQETERLQDLHLEVETKMEEIAGALEELQDILNQ